MKTTQNEPVPTPDEPEDETYFGPISIWGGVGGGL